MLPLPRRTWTHSAARDPARPYRHDHRLSPARPRGRPLDLPHPGARPRLWAWSPAPASALVLANLCVLLLLGAVLAGRLTRVWAERRRGSAGSRLHVRLVMLFTGVAVAPTILVACFAVAFFHFGIQAWFNDPVRRPCGIAAGLPRLSGRAPRQYPRRRAGDGHRPQSRRHVAGRRPIRSATCWRRRPRCAA